MNDEYKALEQALERLGQEPNDATEEQLEKCLSNLARTRLASIKKDALKEYRQNIKGFTERNFQRWKKGFDTLETLIQCCIEAGENLSIRNRFDEIEGKEVLFSALERLHAKGCLIALEIVCLLKGGFADGALARWRALHEIAVTARFLFINGNETAERYFAHEVVESYKGVSLHKQCESRLNEKACSDDEIASLKEYYDKTIENYGEDFKSSYGWAASALSIARPNFVHLEKAVELDHWRVYYKWASQNIHANVKTILNSLGMSEAKEDFILIGPSNSGFVDPAHCTAISLMNLTISLLTISPDTDDLITGQMIRLLADEVGDSFLDCSEIIKNAESL